MLWIGIFENGVTFFVDFVSRKAESGIMGIYSKYSFHVLFFILNA